jgi:tRNA A-37 threonylcarbamoyl transferase component Bud32
VLPPSAVDEHAWKRTFDAAHKREETYKENRMKAYALVIEHCSPDVRAALKALTDWGVIGY